jgi:transmembrane sensor
MPIRWRWPSVAATAVAVVVLGVLLTMQYGVQTLETGIAERRIVRLEDGSQLSLDALSRVEIRLAQHHRDLRLIFGRVRFDVAKDPLRPFNVTAGDKIVVALGTSFSVELLQKQMRLVLYEGRVEVLQNRNDRSQAITGPRELTSGRELWSTLGRVDATVMAADIPRSQSWESGQLTFVDEPLPFAVERINRYSQTKIVIADAAAAAIHVNGVFNAGDVSAFIEGLKSFSSIDVTQERGRLLLSSRAAESK